MLETLTNRPIETVQLDIHATDSAIQSPDYLPLTTLPEGLPPVEEPQLESTSSPEKKMNFWRRAGELALRFLAGKPENSPQTEATTAINRKIENIKAATERQRTLYEQEQLAGDLLLTRIGMKSLRINYDRAAEKAERFTRLANSFTARKQKFQRQGGFFGTILGWANGGFASYFGWRARGAAKTRDYYQEDLPTLDP